MKIQLNKFVEKDAEKGLEKNVEKDAEKDFEKKKKHHLFKMVLLVFGVLVFLTVLFATTFGKLAER